MRLLNAIYPLCLALGGGSIALLAATAPPSEARAEETAPRDAQAIWDKLCKSCHGVDGKGNPKKAKTLKIDATLLDLGREGTDKVTVGEMKTILLEGKDKMPSFSTKVKPEEVDPLLELAKKIADDARKNR
jgi:mono/diheme cytochrome c family protein